jgi:hypothetical protein
MFKHLSSLILVGLLAVSAATPVLANDVEAQNFLAIPAPELASQTISQLSPQAMAQQYVKNQLALHSLTTDEFLALDAPLQRQVLTPGRSRPLTREQRHTMMAKRVSVPDNVLNTLTVGATVDTTTQKRFGVVIPTMAQVKFDNGLVVHPLLFGNSLVMLRDNGQIASVTPALF